MPVEVLSLGVSEIFRSFFIPTAIIVLLLGILAWSWSSEGIVYDLISGEGEAVSRTAMLKGYFRELGAWGPLVYVLFVVVEVVVAPIPGLMLYAPGGIVFGTLLGGTLTLVGNMMGAGIASYLTRSVGESSLTQFFAGEKLERTQQAIEVRGSVLIFFLRLNPLTSSDLVSYAAGFTRIPISRIVLATGLGMAPLCYGQAWLAEGLLTAFPALIYPLLVACIVYAIVVVMVLRRFLKKPVDGEAVCE